MNQTTEAKRRPAEANGEAKISGEWRSRSGLRLSMAGDSGSTYWLKGISGYGFDLVRGTQTLDLIKTEGFPCRKFLFAGIVDGRNIWAKDLADSLSKLSDLESIVGNDKLVVSASCSFMHTAVDLINETKLDDEIKSWLAFAAQKVVEVNVLAKALTGPKDEAFFQANAAAQALRKSSPKVTKEEVQKVPYGESFVDERRCCCLLINY